ALPITYVGFVSRYTCFVFKYFALGLQLFIVIIIDDFVLFGYKFTFLNHTTSGRYVAERGLFDFIGQGFIENKIDRNVILENFFKPEFTHYGWITLQSIVRIFNSRLNSETIGCIFLFGDIILIKLKVVVGRSEENTSELNSI